MQACAVCQCVEWKSSWFSFQYKYRIKDIQSLCNLASTLYRKGSWDIQIMINSPKVTNLILIQWMFINPPAMYKRSGIEVIKKLKYVLWENTYIHA